MQGDLDRREQELDVGKIRTFRHYAYLSVQNGAPPGMCCESLHVFCYEIRTI